MATTKKSSKTAVGVKQQKRAPGAKKESDKTHKSVAKPATKGAASKKAAEQATAKKAGSTTSRAAKADKRGPVEKKPASQTSKAKPEVRSEKHLTDQNLIPVKGEIHQLTEQERRQHESMFRHNQDVALHSEQQKIKAATAANNLMSRKFLKGRNS